MCLVHDGYIPRATDTFGPSVNSGLVGGLGHAPAYSCSTIINLLDEFWSTRRAVMVQLVWTFQHPVTRSDIYSTRLSAYILS